MSSITVQDNLATVQVDLSTMNFLADVEEVQTMYGVKVTLVKAHGPAGGNPLVEVTGPRPHVASALLGWWHMDQDDVDDMFNDDGAPCFSGGTSEAPPATGWNAPDSEALNERIVAGSFYERFRSEANLWNRYRSFKVEKLTTDKLDDFLNDVVQGHDFLDGGEGADVVNPADDGYEVVQVAHVGGRDWVVILGNVGP